MIENVTNPPLQQRLGRGTNTSSTLKLLFQPKPGTKSNIPTIAQLTGYSERTVGRAMEPDVEPAAIQVRYPAGVTRSKDHQERDDRLKTFLDEYCPYQSGTNHRRLVGTIEHLFEQYGQHEDREGHDVSHFTILKQMKTTALMC